MPRSQGGKHRPQVYAQALIALMNLAVLQQAPAGHEGAEGLPQAVLLDGVQLLCGQDQAR